MNCICVCNLDECRSSKAVHWLRRLVAGFDPWLSRVSDTGTDMSPALCVSTVSIFPPVLRFVIFIALLLFL